MEHASHESSLPRLRRIEGQVRGIIRMIEERRYCIQVIEQIRAARAALKKVEDRILTDHIEHCLENAFRSGDPAVQHQKITELIEVFAKRSD